MNERDPFVLQVEAFGLALCGFGLATAAHVFHNKFLAGVALFPCAGAVILTAIVVRRLSR